MEHHLQKFFALYESLGAFPYSLSGSTDFYINYNAKSLHLRWRFGVTVGILHWLKVAFVLVLKSGTYLNSKDWVRQVKPSQNLTAR